MGQQDYRIHLYLEHRKVFADIVNLFFGKFNVTISPSHLQELDSVQILEIPGAPAGPKDRRPPRGMVRERIHDVVKKATFTLNGRKHEMILGIEAQNRCSPSMPFRLLQYDDHMLTYAARRIIEAKELKGAQTARQDFIERLTPSDLLPAVMMCVLYVGAGEWEGFRSLHDMVNFPHPGMASWVPNVPLNLVTMQDILKNDIDSYFSDIGVVASYIVHGTKRDGKLEELLEKFECFKRLSWNGLQLIRSNINIKINLPQKAKEIIDMCKAEKFMRQKAFDKGHIEGHKEGHKEGLEEGLKKGLVKGIEYLVTSLFEHGIDCETIIKDIVKRYNLTPDSAREKVLAITNRVLV